LQIYQIFTQKVGLEELPVGTGSFEVENFVFIKDKLASFLTVNEEPSKQDFAVLVLIKGSNILPIMQKPLAQKLLALLA